MEFALRGVDDVVVGGTVRHPYVWRTERGYGIVVRRDVDDHARPSEIAYGEGDDGLRFSLDAESILTSGPESDDGAGCDEPIVIPGAGTLTLLYTGDDRAQGIRRLLIATGKEIHALTKGGRVLPYLERDFGSRSAHGFAAPTKDWRLYFELTEPESRIALALAAHLEGPWTLVDAPFAPRPGSWDAAHLGPGPIAEFQGRRFMFYNGAGEDGRRRIGWIEIADDGLARGSRCEAPLVRPRDVDASEDEEIVAASALVRGEEIFLYATVGTGRLVRIALTMETATGGEGSPVT